MSIITDEEMIIDIQRVACLLNTNQLSLDEYIDNGGKYNADIIDDLDCGGFANKCSIAGIKVKR